MALSFDCGELDCQAVRTRVPEVTGQAIVLNRGRIAYYSASSELLADPAKLADLIVAQ